MILGDYIGFNESLKDEFKEFVIKIDPELFFDQYEVENIIKTGILPSKFNDLIFGNIYHYLQIYLPKYISAFTNCENLDEGYLYLGVNNSGEITGIPVLGEIKEEDIKYMLESIKDSLSYDILPELKIEIIKLEKNLDFLEDTGSQEIKEKTIKYLEYVSNFKKYCQERDKWIEELMSFTHKISYIILDRKIRNDISKYIREHGPQTPKVQLQADILESDKEIEVLNGIQLSDYKTSDENVYYWVMYYKDMIIEKIRNRKPIKPMYTHTSFDFVYLNYFQLLTKMRYKFIQNNEECNYYIIKITIPGKKETPIYYRHPVYDWKWMMKIRTEGIEGPCCI
jgi:hypothetical protein